MADLEALADDLRAAIDELSRTAGLGEAPKAARKRAPETTSV
jgi:hypothetical protein